MIGAAWPDAPLDTGLVAKFLLCQTRTHPSRGDCLLRGKRGGAGKAFASATNINECIAKPTARMLEFWANMTWHESLSELNDGAPLQGSGFRGQASFRPGLPVLKSFTFLEDCIP